MRDLASAIVDLGAAAQDRRNARRDLRAAVVTVVQEMLRLLRTGDELVLDDQDVTTTYVVEKVTWPVLDPLSTPERILHPKGDVTLAMYAGVDGLDEGGMYKGAALVDVRVEFIGPVQTRNPGYVPAYGIDGPMERMARASDAFEGPYVAELHPATDEELLFFASQAQAVIDGFLAEVSGQAERLRDAAVRIVRLTPR